MLGRNEGEVARLLIFVSMEGGEIEPIYTSINQKIYRP